MIYRFYAAIATFPFARSVTFRWSSSSAKKNSDESGTLKSSVLFFAEQMGKNDSQSIAGRIAPKVLRLLEWIAEVKPSSEAIQKKPPQKQLQEKSRLHGKRKSS